MTRVRRTTIALLIAAALAAVAIFIVGDDDGAQPARTAATKRAGEREVAPLAPAPRAAPEAAPGPTPSAVESSTIVDATNDAAAARADDALTDEAIRAAIARGEPGFEVLASRLAEQTLPIAPRWQAGDQWVVETWYRQAQAHDAGWSGPAVWRFEVTREVSFHDVPCHELVVTRADEAGVAPMTLWVSRAGRLVGAETTVTQQGKQQRSLYVADDGASAEPAPLRAPPGSAPVRLPPLGALARSTPLPFARKRDLPPDLPASELAPEGYDLEFTDPFDGTTVRQRWSPDDPRWPLVSRTETTLSIRRG